MSCHPASCKGPPSAMAVLPTAAPCALLQAIQNAGAVLLQREIPEVVNVIFAKARGGAVFLFYCSVRSFQRYQLGQCTSLPRSLLKGAELALHLLACLIEPC